MLFFLVFNAQLCAAVAEDGGVAGRAGACGWFHPNNTRLIAPV